MKGTIIWLIMALIVTISLAACQPITSANNPITVTPSPTITISSQTPTIPGITETITPYTLTRLNIKTEPSPGDFLLDSSGQSSGVLLTDVEVDKYYADKDVNNPNLVIKKGNPILVVFGSIQNQHIGYPYVIIGAKGYDASGEQIAWTFNGSLSIGIVSLEVVPGETRRFTLKLNYSENVKSIHIYAQTYGIQPP